MESIVVIRLCHILRTGYDAPLAVAEPQAIDDQRVIPVHHQPKQEASHKTRQKRIRSVEYTECHRKDHCGDQTEQQLGPDVFLGPLCWNQTQFLNAHLDCRRIRVDHGQQVMQAIYRNRKGENETKDNALNQKYRHKRRPPFPKSGVCLELTMAAYL